MMCRIGWIVCNQNLILQLLMLQKPSASCSPHKIFPIRYAFMLRHDLLFWSKMARPNASMMNASYATKLKELKDSRICIANCLRICWFGFQACFLSFLRNKGNALFTIFGFLFWVWPVSEMHTNKMTWSFVIHHLHPITQRHHDIGKASVSYLLYMNLCFFWIHYAKKSWYPNPSVLHPHYSEL